MDRNPHSSKKRKKYLEPDASDQEKMVPRTTVWRRDTALNAPEESNAVFEEEEGFAETNISHDDFTAGNEQSRMNSLPSEDEDDTCLPDDVSFQTSESAALDDPSVPPEDVSFLSVESALDDPCDLDDVPFPSGEDDVENEFTEQNGDNMFKSDNISENLKSFDSPLFKEAPTTIGDALLMIMTYAMKHQLTWTAVEDMLKLFNNIFGQSVLPQTKYAFQKIFGTKDNMKFHFYCTECTHYLGEYEGHLTKGFKHASLTCPNPNCGISHNANTLKEGSFFATLSIRKQIAALLDLDSVRDALSTNLSLINKNLSKRNRCIADLTDGELYKEKRRELFEPHDISLTVNSDGSPVFKSSRASMWLIQAHINELPPRLRWAHGILGGLWFGKGHPDMKLFMDVYVKELSELSVQGVRWKDGSSSVESHIFTVCGCFDSPARCAVQNMNQFNGYYGCPWCLHPGDYKDGVMRYPTLEEEPALRTEVETLEIMEQVLVQKRTIMGVKGSSPMILAKGLDFIRGICPEYMHAVLLGVTRQITEILLSTVGEDFYIGSPRDIRLIDKRLVNLKPPHIFTRLPRSLTDRKFWKAHEWKAWLLYYAVPCLQGILPDKYLLHFSLLSSAIFLLLQDYVFPEDISSADEMLLEFVIQSQILYGSTAMTFNMHQMLHLPSSVRDLGPLWAHSAFVFEGGNGKMLNLVTAAKGVPLQILNRFSMEKKLQHLFDTCDKSEKVKVFYDALHLNPPLRNCRTVSPNINVLGKEKISRSFNDAEKQAYMDRIGIIPTEVTEYSRIIWDSAIYHSEAYLRAGKSDNTVIKVAANFNYSEYVKIKKFVVITDSDTTEKCYMLCRELLPALQSQVSGCLPKHLKQCTLVPDGHFILIPVEDIRNICVYLEIDTTQYVSDIPNFFEKD